MRWLSDKPSNIAKPSYTLKHVDEQFQRDAFPTRKGGTNGSHYTGLDGRSHLPRTHPIRISPRHLRIRIPRHIPLISLARRRHQRMELPPILPRIPVGQLQGSALDAAGVG